MHGLRDYVDTDSIKQAFSCVDILAGRGELRNATGQEWAGPCPKCGGQDRLHVRRDGWFCRQCKPLEGPKQHWHDVIGLVEWLDGVDFLEAVRRIDSGAIPAAPVKIKPKANVTVPLQRYAPELLDWSKLRMLEGAIDDGCKLLVSPDGAPWRDYLAGRGIDKVTARAWWLGAGMAWDRQLGDERPAVLMPWIDGDIVTGVKCRFLTVPEGGMRYTSKGAYDRSFALNVFGRHVMGGAYDTLLVVEGELNAVSCWQAVRAAGLPGVDVVSIGSESLPDRAALAEVAGDFAHVVAWLDEPKKAAEVRAILPGATARRSPHVDDVKLDGNEMLQRGVLPDFLRGILAQKGVVKIA